MMREPVRNSACAWHYVNVNVAVIVAGEGDHGAVRREDRITLCPAAARQQPCFAALAPHQPQVAGVGKRDVRFGKRGLLHEQRARSTRAQSTNEDSNDQEQRGKKLIHSTNQEMKYRSTRQLRLAARVR